MDGIASMAAGAQKVRPVASANQRMLQDTAAFMPLQQICYSGFYAPLTNRSQQTAGGAHITPELGSSTPPAALLAPQIPFVR